MEQIEPLLRELAAQLGTTVQYLWQTLINQGKIEFVIGIAYWIIWFIILLGSRKFVSFDFQKHLENDDFFGFLIPATLSFGLLVGFVLNIVNIGNMLTALLNPEYWALQQILEYIR